jgi:hypothetical protein
MTIGVADVCRVLDVQPGELADVFRRECSRHLRIAADALDQGEIDVDAELTAAAEWLTRAEELEAAWASANPEIRGVAVAEAKSPQRTTTAVAADREGSR